MELATSNYLQSIPAIGNVTIPNFRDSINNHHPNKSQLCTSIRALICIDDGRCQLNTQVLLIIILEILTCYHDWCLIIISFDSTEARLFVCLLCLSVASSWQLSSLSTAQVPVSCASWPILLSLSPLWPVQVARSQLSSPTRPCAGYNLESTCVGATLPQARH